MHCDRNGGSPGGGSGKFTLILGGARSGKSAVAERLAATSTDPVTYVATMRVGDDAGLAERVEQHRLRRPARWQTVEAGEDLAEILETLSGTVLLDSLGPWLAAQREFETDERRLCAALRGRDGDTIVVSDEVGLGVVPATAAGGAFRDRLGRLNESIAAVADRVWLVVAGRVLVLGPAPER